MRIRKSHSGHSGHKKALLLAAVLIGAVAAMPAMPAVVQDDLRAARTKGRPDAPITIFEMSDFQCPACAYFFRTTLPVLEREYLATGKAKLVYVNYPLPNHANAVPAAELAMCAARQDKFWPVHDLLFRHQTRWAQLREPGTYLMGLADSAGADRNAIAQCLRSGAVRDLVRADAEGSARTGARSTPSFYIEGGLMGGAQPIEVFRQVLDSMYAQRTRR